MAVEQLVSFHDEWELQQFSRDQQKAGRVLISYNISSKDLRRLEYFQNYELLWALVSIIIAVTAGRCGYMTGIGWEFLTYGAVGTCLSGKEHKITPQQLGAAVHVILSQSEGAKIAFLQVNVQQMTKCHSSNVTAVHQWKALQGQKGNLS